MKDVIIKHGIEPVFVGDIDKICSYYKKLANNNENLDDAIQINDSPDEYVIKANDENTNNLMVDQIVKKKSNRKTLPNKKVIINDTHDECVIKQVSGS